MGSERAAGQKAGGGGEPRKQLTSSRKKRGVGAETRSWFAGWWLFLE